MKKLYTLLFLLPFAVAFGQVEGTWIVAPQAAAIGVGPTQGDISWWSNSEDDLTIRACYFDDKYVFETDGTFSNIQDDETWVEEWQGMDPPACATPVAPHDGSNAATWEYDEGAGTVTLNGVGAYLGLAKVYNGGELTDPANAPASITYIITEISGDGDTLTIDIEIAGGWWRYIMVKDISIGIFETSNHSIKIYPNPVSDIIYLENAEDFEDVSIYTIMGKLIYHSDKVGNSIAIEKFAPGTYTLRATGLDGKQYLSKFMVQ